MAEEYLDYVKNWLSCIKDTNEIVKPFGFIYWEYYLSIYPIQSLKKV